MINIIRNDIPILLDNKGKILPRSTWDKSHRYKAKLNAKATYALLCALLEDNVTKVITMAIASELWKAIVPSHNEPLENSEKLESDQEENSNLMENVVDKFPPDNK